MKLLLSLLLTSLFLFADINSIEDIKKEYANINNNLINYNKTTKDLDGFSTEGGEVIIYKDSNKEVKTIKLSNFGEMGKSIEEYYFDNNQLFFIYEVTYNYNAPSYTPQYDDSKTQTNKDRFYFVNNMMVKWLNQTQSIASTTHEFKEKERGIYNFILSFLVALI